MIPRPSFTYSQFALILIALLTSTAALSQTTSASRLEPQAPAADEKAEEILRRAVGALGGSAFLGVTSVIGRGNYTPFIKGVSDLPLAFVDYIALPDRERTEFKGRGARTIQTNVGMDDKATGWVFDGALKSAPIREMKPEQIEDFRLTLRTSVDNLLRGWWRKAGAKLSYLGRREAGLARRNETVRLTYPDGFAVDFEFDAKDGLPAKVLYKRKLKQNDEEKEVAEEDRYLRFLAFDGVNAPVIIDHYRDGVQTSRVLYDSVEFNSNIPDALFAKPANIKTLK